MSAATDNSLDTLLQYQHSQLVERLADKLQLSTPQATDLFQDLKRFLYLCGISEQQSVPPPLVDAAWHEFLLYTKDYRNFCDRFIGRFVHHSPFSKEEQINNGEGGRRTAQLARKTFGTLSPNWDLKSASDPCDGCGDS